MLSEDGPVIMNFCTGHSSAKKYATGANVPEPPVLQTTDHRLLVPVFQNVLLCVESHIDWDRTL